jgi:AcrR family transcriptional regulator
MAPKISSAPKRLEPNTTGEDQPFARRKTKGEQTVERILDAAEPLFAKRGYEGASLREIARQAGIQQPGLYNYFPSKEALYASVLDRALHPLAEAMDRHMQTSEPDPLQATLAGVMTDLLLEHPQMSGLFQRALQGDPASTGNRLIKGWLDRLFTQAISGLESATATEVDRVDLALETIAMFNLTTGYFLSQRIFETLVGGDVTDPTNVERQKALLERIAAAARRH